MKTDGALQTWSCWAGRVCLIAVSCCIVTVSGWTPLASSVIAQRWFGWPNTGVLLPLPLASPAVGIYAWRALGRDSVWQAFVASIALCALSFLGLSISLWPMIVSGNLTLWEAASPESTQAFLLVGTLVLLPVILFYTGWVVLDVSLQGSARRGPLSRASGRLVLLGPPALLARSRKGRHAAAHCH